MTDAVLILNAGSSSLKFSVHADDDGAPLLLRGQIEGIGTAPHFIARDAAGTTLEEEQWAPLSVEAGHARALGALTEWLAREFGALDVVAAGHRVVHGGPDFAEPVLVDADVLEKLESLVPLAPLHQPYNLAPVRALAELQPELPQIACFDTAFHRTHSDLADRYALPPEYFEERHIRRYGFHGLSYEYVSRRLAEIAPEEAAGRVVIAHLGNGASLCALDGGRCVESTLGFSTLGGLPMGTRCGNIDPGVLLHLLKGEGMSVDDLERLLSKESGLKGMSGIGNDMRELLSSDEPRAKLAVDYFVYQVNAELGRLVAVLGGLDALVFTAGIGEHAAPVRAGVVERGAWLGLALETEANARHAPLVSPADSRPAVRVIPTNEELMIALHARALLARAGTVATETG